MFEEQRLPDSKVSVFQLHPWLRTEKDLRDEVAVSLPLGSMGADAAVEVGMDGGCGWAWGMKGGLCGTTDSP